MIVGIAIGIMGLFEMNNWPVGSSLANLAAGAMLPYLLTSIIDLLDNKNWKTSQRKLKRANILRMQDKVRVSFAYLFRIKVDGKYFLVRNSRGTGKWQPVGGVYKFKSNEAQYLKVKYFVEDDSYIPVDESSRSDYRLQLQNKYLRKFIRRFNKTQNHEMLDDLSREFKEELFDTGLLDQTNFGILKYTYCGRHMTELKYSEHFQCYELLLADIVEVKLNNQQEDKFRQLALKHADKCYLATPNEVKARGVISGSDNLQEIIGDHTSKILQENAKDLTKGWREKKLDEIEIEF